jgi:hypothetical protein
MGGYGAAGAQHRQKLFAAATSVIAHSGKRASFWFSSWMNEQAPSSLYPLLCRHSRRKNRTVREALLHEKWISDMAHNLNADLFFERNGKSSAFQLSEK